MENALLETGLEAFLAEALSAAAAQPHGEPPGAEAVLGASRADRARLALRWVAQGMFERGGIPLMAAVLDSVCEKSAAAPWFRHLAGQAWIGIGTWPDLPEPPTIKPKAGDASPWVDHIRWVYLSQACSAFRCGPWRVGNRGAENQRGRRGRSWWCWHIIRGHMPMQLPHGARIACARPPVQAFQWSYGQR